ncbi:MAG: hypothetical protein R2762_26575 [Bryobacteraceae bacterium]
MNALLQAALVQAGINNTMPGWRIVESARLLPPLPNSGAVCGDQPGEALKKLMKAFYDYGRLHWTWSQSSPGAVANGGLVKGLATNCACASFNLNLKFLAELCGVNGIQQATLTQQFLTVPGGVCIDSKWKGNVRTATQGFDLFQSFKFAQHYWLTLNAMNYDVCYNSTFLNQEQIIWTRLLAPEDRVLRQAGVPVNQLYRLTKPLPSAEYLIQVQLSGPNGWPAWQLVSKDELSRLRR